MRTWLRRWPKEGGSKVRQVLLRRARELPQVQTFSVGWPGYNKSMSITFVSDDNDDDDDG